MTPYVLLADTNPARVATCLDVFDALDLPVHAAGTARETVALLARHGPPALLVLDSLFADADGFAVTDILAADDLTRVPVLLWASSRPVRELARARLAGRNVRILRGRVRPRVLRTTVERLLALSRRTAAMPAGDHDAVTETMTRTLTQAARFVGAAGAAVYWRAPGDTQFRTAIEWTESASPPDVPSWLPQVFDAVIASGQPLLAPNLAEHPLMTTAAAGRFDNIRGLAAVPLSAVDGEVIGMICVFDRMPLVVNEAVIGMLVALGRGAWSTARRASTGRDPRRSADVVPVLDRPSGLAAIHREVARARRDQRQLGVIVFDVDPVASSAGVLRALRTSDLAIHWDDNELLVVLTGVATGDARLIAERLHAALHDASADGSIAGGVSELAPHEPFETVLARAQAKMRLVRSSGRNSVA